MHLEDYLREAHDQGVIDHALRAHVHPDGSVKFYIHPAGRDGRTLDFQVTGDAIVPLATSTAELAPRATPIGTGG